MKLLQKNQRLFFYLCWAILGLAQSRFTELLDDEAYYWVYSKFLDWGYFDHPPMVALLIRAGYTLFHNELGVRLLFVALNVFALMIIEKLIATKHEKSGGENSFLFYGIALALGVLQLGGFLAVPDTPLIFFTALFFWIYQKFVENRTLRNTFLLGIVAAALLYSKYHAVLILLFVLLSNFKLFTRYQTYVAGLIAFLIFSPHLWWQYQHDWISFRYHLFESNVNPYKFSFTLEYIGGQLLLLGPLAGLILFPSALFYKAGNQLEKGLKFTLIGIYLFFLLSSFRGKVEANWTSPAIVPLIILSHRYLSQHYNWKKWLFRLLPATMVLILFARIIMLVDIIPVKGIRTKFHSWKNWPQQMREKTNQLPVVFENSYQRASKYWFYSGQMTYSLNWYRERRNNYNFWPVEDSILGKPVFILDIYSPDSFQHGIQTNIGRVGYRYDSAFSSFAKIQLIPSIKTIKTKADSLFSITILAQLPDKYRDFILSHPDLKTRIVAGVFDKHKWIKDLEINRSLIELIERPVQLTFDPQLEKGKYYLLFSIYHYGTLTAPQNSQKIPLVVE